VAGDVATARAAGTDVTRVQAEQQDQSEPELQAAENGVTSAAAAPGEARPAAAAAPDAPQPPADPSVRSPADPSVRPPAAASGPAPAAASGPAAAAASGPAPAAASGPAPAAASGPAPAAAQPAADGPPDEHPADAGPADAGPADAGPADTAPADAAPADAGPADTGPADTGSAAADTPAADTPAATDPPADGQAAASPGDAPPGEGAPSAKNRPAKNRPAKTRPAKTPSGRTRNAAPARAVSGGVLPVRTGSSGDTSAAAAGTAAVRRRLARLGAPWGGGANPVLEPLIKTVRATHPKADVRLIERAYEVAAQQHAGQVRKSGDPFITHPLAVTTILAELGMNSETLCAALLHDTVEDTDYTLTELRREFGDDVAALVDGVTKLDKVKYGEAAQAETVRKMVVAMSRDIRVLVIKLADRLHNMRTLRYLPREKQEQKSREVLEIFAPLAHRLGMNTVKWELEDLAFSTLFPKRYDEIARLVSERAPRRDVFMQDVIELVSADMREAKIKAFVTGRPKHYYSVYQKMIARNVGFDDIYDLVGIRVLVDSVRDCYAALGTVHARWNPVPGRFKDYIAMPKFNLYQSLHTTVIGPEGKPVELQIRTWGMHKRAEYGVAAHWKYKEEANAGGGRGTADLAWLRQLVDWQRETADPAEFLESLRFDLGAAEVYVFTPRGEVVALPQGASPVDFAYAIHTEVGHRTIGARVNGRLVALESQLNNGDTVEIFTSKAQDAAPSRDWLQFVKSARARNKIRHWFSKERREAAAETGKAAIARAMRKQNLPLQRLATADALLSVAHDLRYADLSALYTAVGESHVSAQSVVTKLVKSAGGIAGAQEDLAETTLLTRAPKPLPAGDSGVVVEGAADVWARLSKCCTPVPGDSITGFVTRGNGVSVHRSDCVNLRHLLESQPERLVNVHWSPREGSMFLVAIQTEALDRTGLLSDVTRAISDQHVNILSASVTTTRDRVAVSRFTFEMGDPKHLGHVLRAVRSVDGVYDVYRITN
jgi:GTP diphosphokinase / guanosine-3',5'-bis(diphosphate) 3'-diphosphatase